MIRQEISILIPVYNDICVSLVSAIQQQALTTGVKFEIIVADDGSTAQETHKANQVIGSMKHCRFIRREHNIGRAAIRNFLARESQYKWLLFLDSHMTISNQLFLQNYLDCEAANVVYGGYSVGEGKRSNLRFLYEKACESQHRTEERLKRPFQHFHTCNFVVRRDIMLAYPFDERFRHYGYEDVLFGKRLKQASITICHIDNPVDFNTFEENSKFLRKTEEALSILQEFQDDLRGYSNMLTFAEGIHVGPVKSVVRFWHWLFSSLERRNLCSSHPSLNVFKLYKIGYFLTINK